MSSQELACKVKSNIAAKELLEAMRNVLDGKFTDEEIENKFTNVGLSLDGEYEFTEIIDKISASSSTAMSAEDEAYEANWIEALRQLAVGLHDEEALQVIAAAKKSMLAAHSQCAVSNDRSQAKDINNNILDSYDSRRIDKEEAKRKETELLKILNDLKVEEESLPISLAEDDKESKIDKDETLMFQS